MTPNGGTSLWHSKGMDGSNPFSHQKTKKCQHRNEPACAGLQSQKGDEYTVNYNPNGSNGGLMVIC
jgi:hypothetical protein